MTAQRLAEGVWRLPLPSATLPPFDHTNSYLIIDSGVAAIVDPGFHEEESLDRLRALLNEQAVRLVKAVLLTHGHSDHLAGLDLVRRAFDDLPVYLHPLEMQRATGPGVQGLAGERVLTVGGLTVRALHTPGHSPGHLCFHVPERGVLLAGDLVAGEGSVWVGAPEGDLVAYLTSLELVAAVAGVTVLAPGHGSPVGPPGDDVRKRLAETRDHRLDRERQVLEGLAAARTLTELRHAVYGELPERLHRPADATLLAHLRKLMAEMRVVHLGDDENGPFVVRR